MFNELVLWNACGQPQSAWMGGKGPLVVLLHGFPDTENTFQELAPLLVRAGYRVLLPRMRGYEPSTVQVQDDYYMVDLAEDVRTWLDQIGEAQVHLIGHDFGALVSYTYASLYPQRLYSLTMLAIPPLYKWPRGMLRVPVQWFKSSYLLPMQMSANWVVPWLRYRNWWMLRFFWQRWSPQWRFTEAQWSRLQHCIAKPGVAMAASGYYRCLRTVTNRKGIASWRALMNIPQVPLLLLTGAKDGCMDSRLYEVLVDSKDFSAGVTTVRLPECGHWLHRERPEDVSRIWLDFVYKLAVR